jgi:predicted transcriptional regulator
VTKTTVYLDSELAITMRQLATQEGRPQAELIRDALAQYARRSKRPAIPGLGEFDSGHTDTSERAEEILRRATKRGKWRS